MATKPKAVGKRAQAATTLKSNKVMELTIKRMPLDKLLDHPRNVDVRDHPEEGSPEWEVLSCSLSHDYFDPIVWNKRNGQLVSGHLRKKVMVSLGVTHADVVVVDYDESTHIARLLAANRLLGSDNKKGMREFFQELSQEKFDLSLTGFDMETIKTKFNLSDLGSKPSRSSGGHDEEYDGGDTHNPKDSTSEGNYEAPSDTIPLSLTFKPADHIEVMSMLRAIRKTLADKEGKTMAELSNSDAVFQALRNFSAV